MLAREVEGEVEREVEVQRGGRAGRREVERGGRGGR
jgi:hypothetical protein